MQGHSWDDYATKKWGDDWQIDREEEAQEEFVRFLYRKKCEEQGFGFDPHVDYDTDMDYLEFRARYLDW